MQFFEKHMLIRIVIQKKLSQKQQQDKAQKISVGGNLQASLGKTMEIFFNLV
jgi:hypothetical protein